MKIQLDLDKTLEQLENDYWKEPEYHSNLVKTCHNLRKKPLKGFEIEDFRILIGQNISLEILIPMAIDLLEKEILAEGDYYKGDLLSNVLKCEMKYWKENPKELKRICETIEKKKEEIMESDIPTRDKNEIFELIENIMKKNAC